MTTDQRLAQDIATARQALVTRRRCGDDLEVPSWIMNVAPTTARSFAQLRHAK